MWIDAVLGWQIFCQQNLSNPHEYWIVDATVSSTITIASWPWPILQWAIPKRAKISGVGGGVDAVFGRLDVGYAGGYCL